MMTDWKAEFEKRAKDFHAWYQAKQQELREDWERVETHNNNSDKELGE